MLARSLRGLAMPVMALGAALAARGAGAATVACVHNPAELQAALDAATGSTQETFIELARGAYATTTPFTFYSLASTQGQLDVTGGYDDACTASEQTPSRTILDGGAASVVMKLESWNGISVRWLTIQNGYQPSNVDGTAGLSVESITGGVIVHYNILRNNVGNYGFAAMYVGLTPDSFGETSSAALSVWGNLIVHNTGADSPAAAIVYSTSSGAVYLTANTIADNVLTQTGAGLTGGISVLGNTTYISNNIVYGSSDNTYDLDASGTPVLTDNDIGFSFASADASSSGNMSIVPRFVGNGDYHLRANSTLLGVGTLTPAGDLPTIDLDGHARMFDNAVDLGAYEHGDEVFADGFDD